MRSGTIHNPSLNLQNTKEGKDYLTPIRKMEPFDRLIYWIKQRHLIHCRRFPKGYCLPDGFSPTETPPPWTEDPILRKIFFCNPYRENDKVTAYLRDNFRADYKDDEAVFLGSILLRWFNYIPTMRVLIKEGVPQRLGGGFKQKEKALNDALKLLTEIRGDGGQLFSNAYIIKLFNGVGKLEAIIDTMIRLSQRSNLYKYCCENPMVNVAFELRRTNGMGNFYIYQFIGDLAYTHVLRQAKDWNTWSFSGPGTSRSINRLQGRDTQPNGKPWERRIPIPHNAESFLRDLLRKVNDALPKANEGLKGIQRLTRIHMRDLTGCLCEYDKYCRALNNERDLKRGYNG